MSTDGRPNLFTHATSELSQDALLCWFLEWADARLAEEDPGLHKAACLFVNDLLHVGGEEEPDEPYSVNVVRQRDRIDIAAEIGDDIVLLIEDKIDARVHGDQLERYLAAAAENWPDRRPLAIYLKTGDQSHYTKAKAFDFTPYRRSRLLAVLDEAIDDGVTNDILVDFHHHLQAIEAETAAFRTTPITEAWSVRMWAGFFMALQESLGDDGGWGYVPNQSGGFMGYWWAFTPVDGGEVYLQLQNAELYARVVVREKERRREIQDRERQRLLGESTAKDYGFRRPRRLGSGGTMAFAEAGEYRQVGQRGLIDMEATIEYLRGAEAALLKASER